ncbi:biotin/lipoyl-binding protein [Marinobacterium sp. D7]|uniref:efflux RND transporter periplasmic adaptor subunit n=1 Tax=Marinobacterium ramblicola TaxID=2849041 RepID=UPI001C2DC505|nr:biotin/lipoyl-binding protein [Marinobacterium ramblicola]MBV1789777.1 biotin/lipoyl-binding protein [Marinobacterium ramblicola]
MSVKRFTLRYMKWLLPLFIFLLAVLTFRTLQATRPQPPAQPIEERSWNVHAETIAPAPLRPEVELYGAIETPKMATLSAVLEADLSELHAQEGERVSPGQLLARLDSRDVEIEIRQQQAQLASVDAQISAEQVRYRADNEDLRLQQELVALKEKDLARYSNLAERNMASQQQIDSARSALQQQRLNLNALNEAIADHPNRLAQLQAERLRIDAQLDSLKLDLERTEIRAPYAARIAAVHVARGDRVRAGDALIDLYGLEQLQVRAQIPERLLSQLRPAMQQGAGRIQASASLDGVSLRLELDRLGATVSSGRAGVDALFRLVDPPLAPEPGRSLRLQLQLPPQEALVALPPTALYGTDRIYRVIDSRLDPVSVERVGQLTTTGGESRVLVRSATLTAGQQVITTQLPNAIAGLLVDVKKATE